MTVSRLPDLGPRGEGWVVLQVILLVATLLAGATTGGAWDGWLRTLTSLVGAALVLVALLMVARGFLDLGRNLTPVPRPRADAQLVETGIYALVRHPLYGGIILGSVGYGLFMASPLTLLLAAGVALFFFLKSQREEAWLVAHYPAYAAYRGRTRRFIPWVL
jgi:protein-S-isoprenylcysteine O-methyltransferase Ste14